MSAILPDLPSHTDMYNDLLTFRIPDDEVPVSAVEGLTTGDAVDATSVHNYRRQ